MAQGLNRVFLIGLLAEQPELRYTRGGRPILIVRLGTPEERFDGDEGPHETVYWHEIVVVGRRAESLAAASGPGTRLLVEGELRSRTYTARDGTQRAKSEVVARRVIVLSGAARTSRPGYSKPRYGTPESPWDEPAFSDDGQGKLF